jgi:hypothetical protein
MRSTLLGATAVAVCLATAGVLAQKQLSLIATITDPNGAEVTTVNPADVRVQENGVAATVLKVEPIERVPKLQVLVDNGSGMPSESLGDLRNGLRGLLEAVPEGVEITIVTTAPQPRFLQRATTEKKAAIDSLNRLAPDTGTGRFVESLAEATQRIERDKQQDASYTIVTVGTSSGDANVRERDVNQTMERLQKFRPLVHVVMFNQVGRSASGGVIQAELGQAAAQGTGGRYENINVANRLASLLPEIGADLGKTLGKGSRQFRFTVERPGGASGDLGKLSMGVAGKVVASVMIDQR